MAATILDALPGEQVLHSNALATVTPHCVVLTSAGGSTQTILALASLSRIKVVTVSYPILLVIATGSLVLGLAAFDSKEGAGAGIPFTLFGLLLLTGYFLSRRGAVSFSVDSEIFETAFGSPGEAKELIAAIESARRLYNGGASTG